MEIVGEVKGIIYQNEVNSYTVAEFETKDEELIIVGYLPFINVGDSLKLIGNLVEHIEYGTQFKIETFEKILPQTLGALERYLSNGVIKGVGPATAKRIVEAFGEETIHVLKFEPQKLSRIKGVTYERAEEISNSFVQNWEMWQIVSYLEKFGIGPQSAQNIYKKLGIGAIDKIEENPYCLIDIVANIDFKQIDKMALEVGIERNNSKRIRSGIIYALMKISLNGHVCVLKENLIQYVQTLLGISYDEAEETFINMRAKSEIVEEVQDEKTWIYISSYYMAENNIANCLDKLISSNNIKKIANLEKKLKKIEERSSIDLSEKQKEAIFDINDNNVCIITGGPGTRKNYYNKNCN